MAAHSCTRLQSVIAALLCLQVPENAWQLDMVFSDSLNDAAFYDTNNGLDYHVPVMGGSVQRPPLRVAHVAVEMAPVAKVCPAADPIT